jgi:hypothetical protein
VPRVWVQRSTDRTLEELADLVLQDPVSRPDRITHAFGFEEFVDLWVGESGVAAEIKAGPDVTCHPRLRSRLRRFAIGCAPKIRFAVDSPLEGDGFELSVPGRAIWPFGRGEDVFQ